MKTIPSASNNEKNTMKDKSHKPSPCQICPGVRLCCANSFKFFFFVRLITLE